MNPNPSAKPETKSTLEFQTLRWLTDSLVRLVQSLKRDGFAVKITYVRQSWFYNKITIEGETPIVKAILRSIQKEIQ